MNLVKFQAVSIDQEPGSEYQYEDTMSGGDFTTYTDFLYIHPKR